MPYSDGDPPSHCSAGQLRIRIVEDKLASYSTKIGHGLTLRRRRAWRWRTPVLVAICTLLMYFSMMEAAAFTDASPTEGAGVCTNKDISIFQSADGSSGMPRYAVQIMNNCMSECAPSDIHVFCGWFASALLVNPNSFKRVAFNDCLVNAGKPLRHGDTLRFTYANSFMYPLRFKSASFCK